MPPAQKLTADEEKKLRILNFIRSSNSVFSSSTLEQVAKAAKVSNMLIKGLIYQLADENLINQDKIGAGTFYWKFQSEQSYQLIGKLEAQKLLQAQIRADIAELDSNIAKLTEKFSGQPDTSALQEQLAALQAELRQRKRKQELLTRNSPEQLQMLYEVAKQATEGANTETDNIFYIVRYLKKELGAYNDQIEQLVVGWNSEFDYVS